jgi:peptidoglycan/LPS O-acetylase OafA/YrhL
MGMDTNTDNSGCVIILVLMFCLVGGVLSLGCIAEFIAELTGIESTSVLNWEFGVVGTLLFFWMFLRNPLLRFALLVTASAIGMIVLLLALNGGDEEALDAWWIKALVAGISVGVGAIYLFRHLKRHPLERP